MGVCAALCLTLVACGSGAGSDQAAPVVSAEAAKVALDQAEAMYTKYTQPLPAATVPELPSAPPQNKRFTIITCPLPVCTVFADGAAAAARKLNWDVTTLQTDNTPESYIKLIDQVAENPPDALTYIPIMPDSAIRPQLAKLQAAGTKISEAAPLGDVLSDNGPVQAVAMGHKAISLSGTLMGSAIVADAKGAAESVFVWDPSFSDGWGPIKDAFEQTVEGAGGSVGVLQVSNANVGKTIASQIVSYLQSHPRTEYVALPVVDYIPGLTAALQAAGISDRVKVISRAANSAALAEIKAGTQWATVAVELAASGYRVVDQVVRLIMGVPLGGRADDAGWQRIFVANNVGDTTDPEAPNYAQAYYTAWRVG